MHIRDMSVIVATIYIFRMMEGGLGVSVRHFVSPRAVAQSKMVS